MASNMYWADNYIEKQRTAREAIAVIRPGQRVFIGSVCGEPQHLVKALSEEAQRLTGLEIIRMMSQETVSLTAIANRTNDYSMSIRSIYLGSARIEAMASKLRFLTPVNMSDVPGLFKTRKLPIHVALIQASPPDDFGWMSLGVSVDVTLAAALSADMVIAQVNPQMPRVLGQSFIHVNDVDLIVEQEEDLLAVMPGPPSEAATLIGQHIARLIDDGATLQIGLDAASQATVQGLSDKNDLGIHSQYLTDNIMHLYAKGVVTNRCKGFNEGKIVATAAIGTRNLYDFIHDNPAIDFHPSDYVNDPFIIAQHNNMVSMNVACLMDLTGQVAAEASAQTFYAGVSGIVDFVRGARKSPGGKSILMLFSVSAEGTSNIVPKMADTTVVVPRGDVQYVVTEYGAVNLFGKSVQERVMAMISIAHPDFRQQLLDAAKQEGMIGVERSLGEAVRGIYPVHLEQTIEVDGEQVTLRPAKPVDDRRIQEHYYNLDKADIYSRFFREKTAFGREDVDTKLQIDYIHNLTLLALVGEIGFGQVVAIGESMLIPSTNMAEVAFSVHKHYQGKGIARRLIRKLADAVRENGVTGLVAYTSPQNKRMINLFSSLPYKVKSSYEDDWLSLSCRFDAPL